MKELEKRRAIQALGQRALDYYIDTGFCVFCDADDVRNRPHEEHCNVGDLSGVPWTPERAKQKLKERLAVDAIIFDRLARTNRLHPCLN